MKPGNFNFYVNVISAFCLIVVLPGSLFAKEPDWTHYNRILKKNVYSGKKSGVRLNLVKYGSIARDPDWKISMNQIKKFKRSNLKTRQEKMAFYLNVYNMYTIDLIIKNNRPSSITNLGKNIWKKKIVILENSVYSLDEIENKVIRPMGDGRIHFALVCAALSCPDLRPEAYTAAKVNTQLYLQTRSFLNNTSKGVRIQGTSVHASRIFEWFANDFKSSGGSLSFIRKYHKSIPVGAKLVTDINYNWSLNGN